MSVDKMMSGFISGKLSVVCGSKFAMDFLRICEREEYDLRWYNRQKATRYTPYGAGEYYNAEDLAFVFYKGRLLFGSLSSQLGNYSEYYVNFWEVTEDGDDTDIQTNEDDLLSILL